MYPDDPFHTLTLPGQIGLASLSMTLAAIVFLIAWRAMLGRGSIERIGLVIGLFYLFIWLSPQAYYIYYMVLLDGLGWQIVIKAPPNPWSVLETLMFQGCATLSAHFKGLFGWVLIAMASMVSRSPKDGD